MRAVGTISVTQEPRAEPVSVAEAKVHLRVPTADDDALIGVLISAARGRTEAILGRPLVLQSIEQALDAFCEEVAIVRCPVLKFGSVQYRDSAGVYQTLAPTVYQVDNRKEPGRLVRAYAAVYPQIRGGEDLNSVLMTYQAGYLAPVGTVDTSAETLEVKDNPFVNGDKVYLTNSGGAVPAGTLVATPYFVVQQAGDLIKLSLTLAGAAVNITDVGTGQTFVSKQPMPMAIKQAILIMLAHWHENREETISGTIMQKVPNSASALLAPYRMRMFA